MKIDKMAVIDHPEMRMFKEYHVERIKQVLPDVEVIVAYSAEELKAKTSDADVLLTWPFASKPLVDFCKGAPSLKWIHAFTAGVDGLMKSELRDMDIRISSTKGIHALPITDHVLAYIFAFLRSHAFFREAQRRKEWSRNIHALEEKCDKTVGVVGLGNIGMEIARTCKLLGMRVLAVKRTPIQSEWVDACYSSAELEKLLKESDFVVLALPLTSESYKMIGDKELRAMKKTAYLINVARGDVVDEEALVKALQEGVIAGAGLDALSREPLPTDSPLWEMPNVILTPHISAHSPHYMDRAVEVIKENLQRYVRDEELLFEADKARGY